MLDGLLGRGFAAKCKSLIKATKARIELIRRKRSARERFLKKDIADLLANRLDNNAYGRTEGLITELTLSSCYDYVEQCCDILYKKLSEMQKHSECPPDCKEAVASLMFSAARVSDFPELRDLREAFQEKYGNSLQYCVNQKFVADLSSPAPPTMEMKIQLMQDIAAEYSISWNFRAFEKQMSKPPVHAKMSQNVSVKADIGNTTNQKDQIPSKVNYEYSLNRNGSKPKNGNGTSEETNVQSLKKPVDKAKGKTDDELKSLKAKDDTPVEILKVHQGNLKDNACTSQGAYKLNARSFNKMIPPPPYVKSPKVVKAENDGSGSSTAASTQTLSSSSTSNVLLQNTYSYEKETRCISKGNANSHSDRYLNYNDSATDQSLPKPKSVRRHSSKPESDQRSSSSKNRSERKQGLRIIFDEDNPVKDDERVLDKLLIHLSTKPASHDPEMLTRAQVENKLKPGNVTPLAPHTRSVSLPHESAPPEQAKVFTRAASFQPDRLAAKHVHPNLPDCDDLAARIAALRGSY